MVIDRTGKAGKRMSNPTQETLRAALRSLRDPASGQDIVAAGMVEGIEVRGGLVQVALSVDRARAASLEPLRREAEALLARQPGVRNAAVILTAHKPAEPAQPPPAGPVKPPAAAHGQRAALLGGVRAVIAVASGKGGVGKSTVAVNLAVALARQGLAVGLLDADIYGPSQQMMLGLQGRPQSSDGKTMEPLIGHGLQVMSIGVLMDADTPMIWRGPMATQALEQLLHQTRWQDLDYLVVDMPPGTGDIQLTLSQRVPLTGAVIVTTPQDIALLDARKGLKMFEKVQVPVLGIVENMATHVCSNCGHVEAIFGSGGGQRMAEEYGVELLGSLPLDLRIREQADSGTPSVAAEPRGAAATEYLAIARRLGARVAQRARDYSARFPTIKVVDT